ncbi:MAG: hypothetical protein KF810_17040 [Rhizobiaceae bacterium]|nr:hypothetical protein [Rhizobiaceae bacterium]
MGGNQHLIPSEQEPKLKSLPQGYAEWKFREAVADLIQECGGNRKIAEGLAIELVKEEVERRS